MGTQQHARNDTLESFIFLFKSGHTKSHSARSKLLSRFQNCLGNRERTHQKKRATTRANVTVALDECLSPPGDSRASGCILPSSTGCPKLHELSNRTSLFGPLHESHRSTIFNTASGFLASQANKQSLKAYRPVPAHWGEQALGLKPLLEGRERGKCPWASRLLLPLPKVLIAHFAPLNLNWWNLYNCGLSENWKSPLENNNIADYRRQFLQIK